jgi:peptide/nickel transport system substrate-binding protein
MASVGVGPLARAVFPDWSKIKQLPYDVARARQLLDSLGWTDADGDGVRARNGVPLAFSVLVPTSSPPRQRLAVLLQEQLRAVGAKVTIQSAEFNAVGEQQRNRRFDATIGAWHADASPGGIRQTWGSLGAAPGGSNFGSYVNPAFDTAVDSALSSTVPARSRAHWLRAYQTIVDDAPAVWLYEPHLMAGAHRRLRVTGLRADGWWAGLADWTIPVTERISRDRVGLR